jgi:hypothetical protein
VELLSGKVGEVRAESSRFVVVRKWVAGIEVAGSKLSRVLFPDADRSDRVSTSFPLLWHVGKSFLADAEVCGPLRG